MASLNDTFTDETGLAHYHATAHGSAAAAIDAIERASDWHNATTRVLLRDLGTMRHAERLAAPAQRVAA